jgi:hypothetical protein
METTECIIILYMVKGKVTPKQAYVAVRDRGG